MLKRAQGSPPKWLAQLRDQLPVERLSTVTYFNLKAIMGVAMPMAGPRAAEFVSVLGLDKATALASVTGLDQKGCVNKTLLSIDGDAGGVLRLADAEPLAPADLAPIPQDATLALAFKLDPEKAFDTILDVAEKIHPRSREEILRNIGEQEERDGFKMRDDFLRPFGDTWCVFDSVSEGGMLSGLTLVVSLKDPKHAALAHAKLLKLLQSGSRLQKVQFADKDIYIFPSGPYGPPFTPAWCMTEKELIVALLPQSIKGYLSRPADFKSLVQSPEVAKLFAGDARPLKLVYCDVQRVFDVLYPMAAVALRTLEPRLRAGGGLDLGGAFLPSAGAIRRHLSPAVTTVRRTEAGIEIIERHALPGPGIATAMPIGVALTVPAVSSSRQAAQRAQSTGQMKQIGLAMLNYEQANRKFPPAYRADKEGKPLLSWRVLILPFVEQDGLYKQFHLDEPWDSEHNKTLIARMPAVYKSPKSKVSGEGKTNYLTIRGEKTVFPGGKSIGFADIRDGTSNTMMTVEVSDQKAVVWTKPDDFEYDESDPLKGLSGLWPGGFIGGMTDGSVRFFPSSIKPETLKAIFTRNGGEVVDWSQLER